ncbi:rCG36082 [Rattus norvegicus]|uniref:RCG36082 n=1 Tax=Rattus norvegicus TaxID=10116 RepID=A6IJI9_RAT|nr:rCG36082 [Rattus norvegicus]
MDLLCKTPFPSLPVTVSLNIVCKYGCPGTHSVDQADLKFRDPPASAS